jgi:hypothetical protein
MCRYTIIHELAGNLYLYGFLVFKLKKTFKKFEQNIPTMGRSRLLALKNVKVPHCILTFHG